MTQIDSPPLNHELARSDASAAYSFAARTLTAHPTRYQALLRIVRGYLDRTKPLRVLELGCGTGTYLLELSRMLPKATFIGVDISAANVAIARSRCEGTAAGNRLEFVVSDYADFQGGAFDVIVSDQTLHLIDTCSSRVLFSKMTADLMPGGLVIADIPYACLYNRLLWTLRRLTRCVRGRTADRIMLTLARLLYGRKFDDPFLAERIVYMYLPPNRYDGRPLRRLLQDVCGLRIVAEHAAEHTSMFQLRHRVVVLRKPAIDAGAGDAGSHDANV